MDHSLMDEAQRCAYVWNQGAEMGQSKIKDIQLNSQNLLVAQDVRKSTVSSIVIVMTPSHDELQWLPPPHAQDINLHFSYILLTYTTYKHQFLVIPPFPSPWRNYIGKVAFNSLHQTLTLASPVFDTQMHRYLPMGEHTQERPPPWSVSISLLLRVLEKC